jgi:Uma2 family endonuclease
MSPLYRHEWIADRLGLFVHLVTTLLRIPCTASASTTFRRHDLDKGIEGDQTFYLNNERRIRGKSDLNLEVDPPPDLAIEVEITHPADDALRIYAALGVPEVWRCDGEQVRFLVFQPDGKYVEVEISLALPFLSASEVGDIILQPNDDAQTVWTQGLLDWIRETLEPRTRENHSGNAGGP